MTRNEIDVRSLDGIVVGALELAAAVPLATRQLADADTLVIKVEPAGTGDFARNYDDAMGHGCSTCAIPTTGPGSKHPQSRCRGANHDSKRARRTLTWRQSATNSLASSPARSPDTAVRAHIAIGRSTNFLSNPKPLATHLGIGDRAATHGAAKNPRAELRQRPLRRVAPDQLLGPRTTSRMRGYAEGSTRTSSNVG